MSTSFARLPIFEIPATLDQRLRRNRRTRRAARVASLRNAGAWVGALSALAAILTAGVITVR